MKKVAVIGAGASGAISAKVLLEQGFDVTIFEKNKCSAGLWNYGEQGSIYKSLRTNLPKEIMIFDREEVPYKAKKSFVPYSDVREYLENNFIAWRLDEITKFNTEAIHLKPTDINSKTSSWILSYSDESGEYTDEFDFIVICNGHYNIPNFPDNIKGLSQVSDLVSHSKYYRSPNNYGQKVLCVGYASSGMDIAQELLNSGRDVYVAIINCDRSVENVNLSKDTKELKFISSPKGIRNNRSSFVVATANDNNIEVDDVIFCTGYKYDFPFLSQNVVSTKDNIVTPLYNQLLSENYYNLAFVGLSWKSLPFILAENQAIFLSKFWQKSSKGQLDIIEKLESSKSQKLRLRDRKLSHYHMLGDELWKYNLNLLELVEQRNQYQENRLELIKDLYKYTEIQKASNPFTFREKNYSLDFDMGCWSII